MTHDDTSTDWDPEVDDTEWWRDDHLPDAAAGAGHHRGRRRLVTIVGLLTVLGFGAATVVSTGGTDQPAVTTPTSTTTIATPESDV
ncbi:hypothetical protein [Ilumatobacter coccineus]|uniref:hypothetical protein n=1 Tax=Ilumatobacter coccineus TaxID=467094 RepID=UPI00034553FA|nr:hypothetical protein [Ilumatobacter coccineus]